MRIYKSDAYANSDDDMEITLEGCILQIVKGGTH